MRLVRTSQGVTLASVSRAELLLLHLVAPTADFTSSPELRRRFFPDPVSFATDTDAARSIREDWVEFALPQIEQKLLEAQETVRDDLEGARPSKRRSSAPRAPAQDTVSIPIPEAHGEAWYSALNQARLALDYTKQNQPKAFHPGPEPMFQGSPKFFLEIQNAFYARIQTFLLETLLDRDS
ncbi:MAG TPA: hypothetical protein VMN36_11710 [Verrucomicrobiales bacterium]|nr:hypothetical protein [Verrucomicrobiales bacterium]